MALLSLLTLPLAAGWSGEPDKPHHADLAEAALAAVDPDQAAPIRAHLDAYRAGALDADVELAPQFHRYSPTTGAGRALDYVERASARLNENLTARNATAEDARQLGILAHVLLDLTQPLHTGNGTIGAPHHAEYEAAAYDYAMKLKLEHAPPSEGNLTAIGLTLAATSARRADELASLLEAEGPWSERIENLTNAALSEGLPQVAAGLASLLPDPPSPPPDPRPGSPGEPPEVPAPTPSADSGATQGAPAEIPASIMIALAGGALGLIVKQRPGKP